jgi:hypothetical protein
MLEAFGSLRPIEISACTPCHLFWFDKSESVRLTPKSVLEVFQFIGRAGQARNALKSQFACPICSKPLALTHDLQRNTRFTYWRCGQRSWAAHHVPSLSAREEFHPGAVGGRAREATHDRAPGCLLAVPVRLSTSCRSRPVRTAARRSR